MVLFRLTDQIDEKFEPRGEDGLRSYTILDPLVLDPLTVESWRDTSRVPVFSKMLVFLQGEILYLL